MSTVLTDIVEYIYPPFYFKVFTLCNRLLCVIESDLKYLLQGTLILVFYKKGFLAQC